MLGAAPSCGVVGSSSRTVAVGFATMVSADMMRSNSVLLDSRKGAGSRVVHGRLLGAVNGDHTLRSMYSTVRCVRLFLQLATNNRNSKRESSSIGRVTFESFFERHQQQSACERSHDDLIEDSCSVVHESLRLGEMRWQDEEMCWWCMKSSCTRETVEGLFWVAINQPSQ